MLRPEVNAKHMPRSCSVFSWHYKRGEATFGEVAAKSSTSEARKVAIKPPSLAEEGSFSKRLLLDIVAENETDFGHGSRLIVIQTLGTKHGTGHRVDAMNDTDISPEE
jgi:hypothetical protein